MNEVVETLKKIEEKYKLFQQQQFTFIRALERTREEAHDMIRPVSSIVQVQCYKDHHCYNSTDRRILNMFVSLCNELRCLCQRMETVHAGDSVTNGLLEKCKLLLNDSNDLTALRATYPHGVVNHLSLEEAQHRYGGVVSVLPIVLDSMRDWVTHSKLKVLYIVSPGCARCKKETRTSQTAPEALTSNSNENTVKLQEKDFKKFLAANQRPKKKKAPWRPPGKHPY